MLVIRSKQIKTFKKAVLHTFEDRMVAHLFEFAGWQCQAIGEDKVREIIRLGIERAREYELTNQGPVRFYIEMMFMFGNAFDTDPLLPWTEELQKNKDVSDQMSRADRLYEKVMDYVDKVVGPDGAHELAALRRISMLNKLSLLVLPTQFIDTILVEMRDLYPQKFACVGEESLRVQIRGGIREAKLYHLSEQSSIILYVALKFVLGHGLADDPLYPGISKALKDSRSTEPVNRAKRLEEETHAYLKHALGYGGGAGDYSETQGL